MGQDVPTDDYEIILNVLAGDRNAYAELVRRYQSKVRGYCAGMLSNSSLADDAAQEIFVKAYQALANFRGNSSFSTWLYRISTNHCLDLLRKSSRRKTDSLDALIEKDGDRIEAMLSISSDAPNVQDHTELISQILSHLSEKSRQIIVLREMQGLSYEHLADTLGCSLDAVKSRLKRARQELESKLRHFVKLRASKG